MTDTTTSEDFPFERLQDVLSEVLDELKSRSEVEELPPSDVLAIFTAVRKAIYRGFFEGAATVATAAAKLPTPVTVEYPELDPDLLVRFDLWAQKYGDEGDEVSE